MPPMRLYYIDALRFMADISARTMPVICHELGKPFDPLPCRFVSQPLPFTSHAGADFGPIKQIIYIRLSRLSA